MANKEDLGCSSVTECSPGRRAMETHIQAVAENVGTQSWLVTGQGLKLDLLSSPCNIDKLRLDLGTTKEAAEDTMPSEGDYTGSRRQSPVIEAMPR